jgi:ligand-binding SRPBCC domain-containing protein
VDAPHRFVDEQRAGPYRMWYHEHHFRAVDGGVEMSDILHYASPLGWLGRLAHALSVGRKVRSIFTHRDKILQEIATTGATSLDAG